MKKIFRIMLLTFLLLTVSCGSPENAVVPFEPNKIAENTANTLKDKSTENNDNDTNNSNNKVALETETSNTDSDNIDQDTFPQEHAMDSQAINSSEDSNYIDKSGTWNIYDILYQEVPELEEWAIYIQEKTDSKAYLIIYPYDHFPPTDLYMDGWKTGYLGKYYSVYVGEQWEDRRACWSWFFVSEDLDEVFWNYIVDDVPWTLEEWRSSSFYPNLDD